MNADADIISKLHAIFAEQRGYHDTIRSQKDARTLDYGLYLKFLQESKVETALLIYDTLIKEGF